MDAERLALLTHDSREATKRRVGRVPAYLRPSTAPTYRDHGIGVRCLKELLFLIVSQHSSSAFLGFTTQATSLGDIVRRRYGAGQLFSLSELLN